MEGSKDEDNVDVDVDDDDGGRFEGLVWVLVLVFMATMSWSRVRR